MSRAKQILDLYEKWVQKVKVKHHPPEGLFKEGSAEDIAKWAKKTHKDLKSAMAALNFFLNRGGKGVDPKIKKKVEKAKELLRKMFGEKE